MWLSIESHTGSLTMSYPDDLVTFWMWEYPEKNQRYSWVRIDAEPHVDIIILYPEIPNSGRKSDQNANAVSCPSVTQHLGAWHSSSAMVDRDLDFKGLSKKFGRPARFEEWWSSLVMFYQCFRRNWAGESRARKERRKGRQKGKKARRLAASL